jgi:FkbM family methyltransferase
MHFPLGFQCGTGGRRLETVRSDFGFGKRTVLAENRVKERPMWDQNLIEEDVRAIDFCKKFLQAGTRRYIFGRNDYAASIANAVSVEGFIDDFTEETTYLGKPIVKIGEIPKDSMIVSVVVVGKPFVAEKRIQSYGLNYLDYCSFYRYSGLNLKPLGFGFGLDEFSGDYKGNRDKYHEIYGLLHDEVSRDIFQKVVSFRLTYNLDYMRSFSMAEDRQYFEDFLELKETGETFVDVGGFDGYTTLEFIKRCPQYACVHFFEPDPVNMEVARKRLSGYANIVYHPQGLSDRKQVLNFMSDGSSSRIVDGQGGEGCIEVAPLDDVVNGPASFIKMDIEGAEYEALSGAKETILKYHPRLAVSVYHRCDDFWRIPELILGIRRDYHVFLRHYTEGLVETVMFFIPKKSARPA